MRKYFFFISILLPLSVVAQNKCYIEEIALYHLDSLTKIDAALKDFEYFTNGYLSEMESEMISDTTYFNISEKNRAAFYIKVPFKNLQIVEDDSLTNFAVPKKLRGNVSSPTLEIKHFDKSNNKYYVVFTVRIKGNTDYDEKDVLIVMNLNGDLIERRYITWIE